MALCLWNHCLIAPDLPVNCPLYVAPDISIVKLLSLRMILSTSRCLHVCNFNYVIVSDYLYNKLLITLSYFFWNFLQWIITIITVKTMKTAKMTQPPPTPAPITTVTDPMSFKDVTKSCDATHWTYLFRYGFLVKLTWRAGNEIEDWYYLVVLHNSTRCCMIIIHTVKMLWDPHTKCSLERLARLGGRVWRAC